MASDATSGGGTTYRSGFDLFTLNVNLIALLAALIFTFTGVKLTSFLPSKYYFSFSKLVDNASSTTPFLITNPPFVTPDDVCKALEASKETKLKCESENKDDASAAPQKDLDDASYKKETQIADQLVRQTAQQQSSFSNIIGFAIRLCVPLLVGFIVARIFGQAGELAAAVGAAAAALLLCWPVIILWTLVVTEGFKELYGQFLLLYVLSCVSFFYMAKIGAIFGRLMGDTRLLNVSWSKVFEGSMSKIIESSFIAIITGVGMKFVEHLILKS